MKNPDRSRTTVLGASALVAVLSVLMAPVGWEYFSAMADTGGGTPSTSVVPDPVSDAVAATPAEFRVDESGAATYSIPIYAVPGTAGVVPQLSLNYSSQGGYGPLGKGWSIGGTSAIGRCRATREAGDFISSGVPVDDGSPRPVSYASTDRYCLDGQRLLPAVGGAACPALGGMTVQTLRTEIESFQRVCAYTPSGGDNGPSFFTVERKDGSISWYGDRDSSSAANRPDGYVETKASGHTAKAMLWAQTRFQDSAGNYIDYHYLENHGSAANPAEHLLREVRYTGKTVLTGQAGSALAPYAKVIFNYTSLPSTAWSLGYSAAGAFHTQRWRLTSVTSCAAAGSVGAACTLANQARHYALAYAASASGSGLDRLASLTECRDNTASAVCAAPTTFEWSAAKYEFATVERPANLSLANDHIRGFKMGDINGDGRQDVAFQYLAGSGCVGGTWIVSTTSTLNASGTPTFANAVFNCVPANIVSRGDGAWHLFDYDGDGRDDLFVSRGVNQGWQVHPSTGTGFNMSVNLISGLSPVIPSVDSATSQAQLADINGDGLVDVIYPRGTGLYARLMQRQGSGFGWGSERTIQIDEGSIWSSVAPACNGGQLLGGVECSLWMAGMPSTKSGFMQMVDFNGDASSDVLMQVSGMVRSWTGNPGCTVVIQQMSIDPAAREKFATRYHDPAGDGVQTIAAAIDPCWDTIHFNQLHAMAVTSVTATRITLSNYGGISTGSPSTVVPADVNGDGLTDLFVRNSGSAEWQYAVNRGNGFVGGGTLALANYREQARFADVNGDGRTDMLYLADVGGNKVYYVRHALPGGGFAAGTALRGGNARLCEGSGCNPTQRAPLFGDFDGDGNGDFLSFNFASSNLGIFVSRGNNRYSPRDVVTRIVNGYGAVTQIVYAPLTNKDLYRRDFGSRNGLDWGRGSPVTDLLAPMYAVARASSSSPQAGSPNAMATVHYRYAGAKMQAGGRGFLGFREIITFDPNHVAGQYVVTGTTYRQDFPFTGMPQSTVKRVVTGTYAVAACLNGSAITDACFATPGQAFGSVGGVTLSTSTQVWEADTDIAAALRDFNPGERRSIHVRTAGTVEIMRDPFTNANTSRVETLFVYGAYGNVTATEVATKTGGGTLVSTVTTANTYGDNGAKWRLGRLKASTVTHSRPNREDVVRASSFAYDMDTSGAMTGQMLVERVQSGGGARLDLRTHYDVDQYGNRLRSTTCAAPATDCATATFAFQPATATRIHRYTRTVYDGRGRYPTETWEPFRTASASSDVRTQRILGRDIFGNVTRAYDLNGVDSFAVSGTLGRAYYSWAETVPGSTPGDPAGGVEGTVTYRWCGSASGQVPCPAGAKLRQQTVATGAPAQWSYLDVLGRPILQVAQSFNVGVSGKDATAVCTAYDAAGRPRQVSNPFFLSGATSSSGPPVASGTCTAAVLKWTTTAYDAIGRPVRVDVPKDFGGVDTTDTTYSGLTTTVTDPRGNATVQLRNALGELVRVTDALGTQLNYVYYADGSLYYVRRNVGRGNIDNVSIYDASGRKIQQTDPDSGVTRFEYNALGELTAQVDAAGNRIEHWYDARGRVWRKVVKRADGLTESESLYAWDTAVNGRGQLASESIGGTYDAWIGQSGTGLSLSRSYRYDLLGRPSGSTTVIDGTSYPAEVQYDALGRAWNVQDASGRWAKTQYNARGFAVAVCNSSQVDGGGACPNNTNTYLRTQETDAWGHVIRERRGNNAAMDVVREYWSGTGRIAGLCAGNAGTCNLMDEGYAWDAAGNLSTQIKEDRYQENFTYDALNRLVQARVVMRNGVTANTVTLNNSYDRLGNVCQVFGTAFVYQGRAGCGLDTSTGSGGTGATGPHRVSQYTNASGTHYQYHYDIRGNQTVRLAAGANRTIRYSFDDKAHEIELNGAKTRFWYGSDGQRYKREHGGKRTLYLGNVEIETAGGVVTTKRTVAGVLLQTIVGSTATNHYLFHDHLGSLVRTTNASGTAIDGLDYRHFGYRRNYTNPSTAIETGPALTARGFTGHEHVDASGMQVIHMNGRIYDPALHRFLQADPVIQAPGNLQSWNAYTYVFNNPLRYTDPTGMFSLKQALRVVVGIVVAIYAPQFFMTYMNMSAFAATVATGFVSGAISTGTMKGALIGAFIAGLTYGVAQGMTGNTPAEGLADASQLTPSDEQLRALSLNGPRAASGTYRINIAGDGAFLDAKTIGAMDIRTGDIVFTNGIKNSFGDAIRNGTTQVFQTTGGLPSSYVLNYNPTTSFVGDVIESGRDLAGAYFNASHSGLAKSLAQTVHVASQNGVTGLQLIGHSQGGAITASALRYASANGMSLSALQGGSVALHGAPINNIFATRYLSSRAGVSITTRAQFGDLVNNVLGFNFLQSPLRLPAALVRGPNLFSNEIQISPHTSPCLGPRSGLCN